MKNTATSILLAGLFVLLVSIVLMYAAIFLFPALMEEYYNAAFRSSSFETDWLFYAHPFLLSIALRWFWEQFKANFDGSLVTRAIKLSWAYGLVAMLPVLWLTFSAIDISVVMVFTWLVYGMVQSFIAGLVFAKMLP
jgi:hypothetical protein